MAVFLPLSVCVKSSEVLVSLRRSPAVYVVTTGMLRQQYDTSAVVSARAHGSCSVPYSYGFFHQVDFLRTVSTRQNKECLTERIDNQWHPCSVECTCTFA